MPPKDKHVKRAKRRRIEIPLCISDDFGELGAVAALVGDAEQHTLPAGPASVE